MEIILAIMFGIGIGHILTKLVINNNLKKRKIDIKY